MSTEGQEPQDTNPTPEESQADTPEVETFDRAYVEKLRREAAQYRTRAKELEDAKTAEEQKRLEQAPLEERLKTLEAEREQLLKRAEEAEAKRVNAERTAALTGKVASPKAALKLLEDAHLTDDGVDIDALLKDYPFLAIAPDRPAAPAASGAPTPGGNRPLEAKDFRGKSEEWRLANIHRLK
jgi:hypothetical protein